MSESEEAVEEKKDRKELIAEALAGEHNEVDFDPEPEPVVDEPVSEATEEISASEEEQPKEVEAAPEVEASEDEVPVEAPEIILPPAELDESAKAEFAEWSPAAQKAFNKRFMDMRRDYTAKTTELAQQRQKYQGLDETFTKHTDRLARKGVTIDQAVNNALAWDHFVETEGANAALQWLEAHGYDPEELIEARDSGEAYSNKQARLPDEVQKELDESRRFRQQIQQEQQQAQANEIYQAVEAFKASKPIMSDPSTAEQVSQAMTPVVQGLRQANPQAPHSELLERAYNYVINGDERFRALVNGAEKRKQIEAERERTQKATRAASSVAGNGPGSGSPSSVPKGRRNIIAAALDGRLTL